MTIESGHKFGPLVRQYREENDITEKTFCAKIGRSTSWLYSFERGIKGFYGRTAQAIFRAYPELRKVVE